MHSPQARHRHSSAASQRPAELALRAQFQTFLVSLSQPVAECSDSAELQPWIETWRRIYNILLDSAHRNEAQDAFRRVGGLEAVITSTRAAFEYFHSSGGSNLEEETLFEFLALVLEALSECIFEHSGNRKYFESQVEGNGWNALQSILISHCSNSSGNRRSDEASYGRLFGCLFAFALRRRSWLTHFNAPQASMPSTDAAILWNPEAVPVIFEMWLIMRDMIVTSQDVLPRLSSSVLDSLVLVSKTSERNRIYMHRTGLAGSIINNLFSSHLQSIESSTLRTLSLDLLQFGLNTLKDAQGLFHVALSSLDASEFLIDAIKSSRGPMHIQFDLSTQGFASIELSELKGIFPPAAPSIGFTFMAWLRVEKYDERCHTTIFGALDASQTCFVLLYLERDTNQLVYQTSVTSSRPSIRFKSVTFTEDRWYHIAVVHKRTGTGSASRAALFVNGEFCEQVKCNFPGNPPLEISGHKRAARGPVQAFLGTPRDLAPRKELGRLSTKFSLATVHLFSEALPDELVFVYEKLGPRYSGNFQDCLGSFQTYRASAELNLRNEILHAGKEDASQIAAAIRLKASRLNPERQLLLGITGTACVNSSMGTSKDTEIHHKGSSIETNGNFVVVNTAVPSVAEAFTKVYGHAVFTGGAITYASLPLDDACWRLSGSVAVGLKLISVAQTDASIVAAVKVLFELIQESWRNSEAMERENGFGLLAWVLRNQIDSHSLSRPEPSNESAKSQPELHQPKSLSYQLLDIILRFVGFNDDSSQSSMIINPLAYRILLVDSDIWRRADFKTQELYYDQFEVFALRSQHKNFNAKRLNRMRIVKKFLDSFKGDAINAQSFPLIIRTFKALVQCTMSAEVMRALALFVTFALHDKRVSGSLHHRKRPATPSSGLQRHLTVLSPDSALSGRSTPNLRSDTEFVTIEFLGISVLDTFADLLCGEKSTQTLKRFAKTVTNKWLLHLFAEDDEKVVVTAVKILSRLLVTHGPAYIEKFSEKTKGFDILQERLKRWWAVPEIWIYCFAILLGIDAVDLEVNRAVSPSYFLDIFAASTLEIRYPGVLPVLCALLQESVRSQLDTTNLEKWQTSVGEQNSNHSKEFLERLSNTSAPDTPSRETAPRYAVAFLAYLNENLPSFQVLMLSSSFLKDLIEILYRATIPDLTIWTAEQELGHTESASTAIFLENNPLNPKPIPVQRSSSFVFVSSQDLKYSDGQDDELEQLLASSTIDSLALSLGQSTATNILNLLISVFTSQLLHKPEFVGFGLFLKVPPGPFLDRSAFKSFIMETMLLHLSVQIEEKPSLFFEPRTLTNLARLTGQLCEASFEGWFLNGAVLTLDFVGRLMTFLQGPEVRDIKSVRLCTPSLIFMRNVARRLSLMNLSLLTKAFAMDAFLKSMTTWLNVLLYQDDGEDSFIRLLCYLLYRSFTSGPTASKYTTIELWRTVIAHEPEKIATAIVLATKSRKEEIGIEFVNISQADNESFSSWLRSNKKDIEDAFLGQFKKSWAEFVKAENNRNFNNARTRISKRKERLRQWQASTSDAEDIWSRHEVSTSHWIANIQTSELLKHQRAGQDQQDNAKFLEAEYSKLEKNFRRTCESLDEEPGKQWQLDEAEGRDRIRLRLVASTRSHQIAYKPKRNAVVDTPGVIRSRAQSIRQSQRASRASSMTTQVADTTNEEIRETTLPESTEEDLTLDGEEFEIVPNPTGDVDDLEDKNRKVLRSLQRGEEVQNVCNVSRIVGLEACESLLIIGKDSLYLLDNLFQRSDGEIVNVWHAPQDERDPYVQLIAGREPVDPILQPTSTGIEKRHWAWSEIISISKRHFLFRDVALEAFFKDGRSYLLTTASVEKRDELHAMLLEKAPDIKVQSNFRDDDDLWRLALLKQSRNPSQTLGFKLPNVFGTLPSSSATRSWERGEISNFHYLMMINTLAGRTFNDLTQYPVFPWVIADYTSDELDLTNPRTFRDLSRPMGCQTLEREAAFKERYQSFGEMTDHQSPAFHYGTHYSSAMIVTSFLIRLQPFVHSYILLQGGSFDHADRLFYSIERAWLSASREGMSDVRELTPEFFYLPDFLTNVNKYDFGTKEGDGEAIGDVILPPWAKGDPTIFISKHREALECKFVSENLHRWIDLVFGFKQQGEAAVEATNVFHHLSYHGARDLDTILDPMERLATIGIIHNFGQTPRQVFPKPHDQREEVHLRTRRLDTAVDSLAKIPSPILDAGDIASNLIFSVKKQRLMCSGRNRILLPPEHDIYMEWGFADGSVRFFALADKKLHQAQISCALFADPKTLITVSYDCTVAVWWVTPYEDSVVLHPKGNLFGHREPISALTASRALSVIVSASSDGQVLLWDLNRLEYVRELKPNQAIWYARINNSNGHILLCTQREVFLYTLNGALLLEQIVCDDPNEDLLCCAFYESESNEWLEKELIFTGHKQGVVKVWCLTVTHLGKWQMQLINRLDHADNSRGDGYTLEAGITSILPMTSAVYAGNEKGHVYKWEFTV